MNFSRKNYLIYEILNDQLIDRRFNYNHPYREQVKQSMHYLNHIQLVNSVSHNKRGRSPGLSLFSSPAVESVNRVDPDQAPLSLSPFILVKRCFCKEIMFNIFIQFFGSQDVEGAAPQCPLIISSGGYQSQNPGKYLQRLLCLEVDYIPEWNLFTPFSTNNGIQRAFSISSKF